jgi:predicted nucleic acid-binding protein
MKQRKITRVKKKLGTIQALKEKYLSKPGAKEDRKTRESLKRLQWYDENMINHAWYADQLCRQVLSKEEMNEIKTRAENV